MRDLDRMREKIEVRLEPRQVVMLALATTLFSGGLFAAGYAVGQRQAPTAVAATDDLATLDAAEVPAEPSQPVMNPASALGEVEFLFPNTLGSRPARQRPARKPMRLPAEVVAPAGATPTKRATPAQPTAPAKTAPAKTAPTKRAAVEDAPAPARPTLEVPRIAVAPLAAAPAPKAAAPIAAPAPLPPPPDEDEPPTAEPAAPSEAPLVAPRKLTLQVKAAQEKAEADAFVAALRRAGFEPHVILADVPGKGRFYRVRVGRFESMPEAREFQRKYKALSGQPDGGFITDL